MLLDIVKSQALKKKYIIIEYKDEFNNEIHR